MKFVHRIIFGISVLLLIFAVARILNEAGDYYLLSQVERPHLADHKLWKPGGSNGHGLGVAGTTMIVIMLGYSLRKRIGLFRGWGRLATWLNYHIFLGIAGPVLITLHTSLKFGGLISVAYWSMLAVAISGFVGRYIYIKIPRHINGDELTARELAERQTQLQQRLEQEYRLSGAALAALDAIAGVAKLKRRGLMGIFTLLLMDLSRPFTINRALRPVVRGSQVPAKEVRSLRRLLRNRIQLSRRIAFWESAQQLFHYWHVIHRPFAYTMIVIVTIHIYIALQYGYNWIG
ncbi:MAG: hypothetical protein ABIA75_00245 [Candidatus Neomarinimicrobiota bacterium]